MEMPCLAERLPCFSSPVSFFGRGKCDSAGKIPCFGPELSRCGSELPCSWSLGGGKALLLRGFGRPTGACKALFPRNRQILPCLALLLLVLHRMTLTSDEIQSRKDQLRQEILERECLLAALEVLHKHATGARGSRTIDVGALLPALLGHAAEPAPAREITLVETPAPTLPPPPPPKPYVHPELEALRNSHGQNTRFVQWAIDRLTGDYTLADIQALLKKEGRPITGAEISVVLSRLKKRREIIEIHCGIGRKPSIFRKPPPAEADAAQAAA